jgi:hypothetical protein
VKMEWVQCDECEKWRRVPLSVVSSWPDQWYCHMNKWDSKRNHCSVPEEEEAEEDTNQSSVFVIIHIYKDIFSFQNG